MAIKNYASQLKYTGAGYLDVKMNPVKDLETLKKKFSISELTLGQSITVLNVPGEKHPVVYYFYYEDNDPTKMPIWQPMPVGIQELELSIDKEKATLNLSENGTLITEVDVNDIIEASDIDDKLAELSGETQVIEEAVNLILDTMITSITFNEVEATFNDGAAHLEVTGGDMLIGEEGYQHSGRTVSDGLYQALCGVDCGDY